LAHWNLDLGICFGFRALNLFYHKLLQKFKNYYILNNMKELLEKHDLLKPPKVGEIVEGKVIEIGKGAVFLDLGPKGTGIIYGKEFMEAKEKLKNLKIGEKIFAKIIDLENEEGYRELSLTAAGKEIAWEELRQKKEKEERIKVKILKANKGGLISEISGIPAFLPVSQLSSDHYPKVEGGEVNQILRELQKFINKELEVKILNIDQNSEQIILSERLIEQEAMKEILKNYKVGDVVKGEISGITDFGAFIKFGKENLEGLCHISELDWQIVEDPSDIVKIGQKVKAKIIDISNGRVSLSLKALKKDPWQDIEKKYKKGDIVSGKVTKLNPFGVFVQITPKIQGLCHISEFGSQKKMQELLEIGKKYNFKILLIEPKEHRMNLELIRE